MTFIEWLDKHTEHNNAIGDLARDIKRDSCFPAEAMELDVIKEHLRQHGAIDAAVETLEIAWGQWQSEDTTAHFAP